MTIFFPDVSVYNQGDPVLPGTVVVVARATLGSSYADPAYENFKAQANAVGAFFVAYHWLNHNGWVGQAEWAYQRVGPDTPLMLDCEDMPGNTGYAGALTVNDILGFVTAYRQLGGICNLVYLPHWYWQGHMGGPDLTPLVKAGLHLVASEYRTYDDKKWPTAYGSMNVEEWQYTDNMPYGWAHVDFNAYQGTVDQFKRLAMGESTMSQPVNSDHVEQIWQVVSDAWTASNKAGDQPPKSIGIQVWEIHEFLKNIPTGTGLSDADRSLIKDQTAAINRLSDILTKIGQAVA